MFYNKFDEYVLLFWVMSHIFATLRTVERRFVPTWHYPLRPIKTATPSLTVTLRTVEDAGPYKVLPLTPHKNRNAVLDCYA